MERLSETDDADESRDHRTIARWIKHFTEYVPTVVEGAYESSQRGNGKAEGEFDPKEGGSPYMDSDGGALDPDDV